MSYFLMIYLKYWIFCRSFSCKKSRESVCIPARQPRLGCLKNISFQVPCTILCKFHAQLFNPNSSPRWLAHPVHLNLMLCKLPSPDHMELHQPRLWFITGGYLVKRWFITAAARARGQSNDLNREILASNLCNCHKEVINAPPVPSISRCIHIVYQHKNVWEYQWSNFIYNCMSTFLHYVHCKDALLDCSAPGGERCESLTWVDEIYDDEQASA